MSLVGGGWHPPSGLSTLLFLHQFKLCFQVMQALFLRSHILSHAYINLADSELFAYLFEIHLCGHRQRQQHVPILKSHLFLGVFDLHDGCRKRALLPTNMRRLPWFVLP
jgi:hypothetical protein